jgi:hypothetical protein
MNIEKDEIIKKYSRFRNSDIWKEIKNFLQSEIDRLELDLHTVGGNEMIYSSKDLNIKTIECYTNMVEYPDNVIKNITMSQSRSPFGLDPYEDD